MANHHAPAVPGSAPLRVALTGASGLIGRHVAAALRQAGHRVDPLVRRAPQPGTTEIRWDPARGDVDAQALSAVDAVVHLAGETIAAGRWTPARKAAIRDSRVLGTMLLSQCLAQFDPPPRVFVSASAIGYYGDRGDEMLDESHPPGHGFLADVCREWEAATAPARQAGIRVVNLRIGMVLSRDGGALPRMLTPFKLGLGGRVGSGRQYMSWIALPDLVRVFEHVIATEELRGPVNAVAPQAVTNAEFTRALGRVLRRPTILPAPAFAVRLVFGEMGQELLLASTRVVPRRLEATGFAFELGQLEAALRAILRRPGV
jgi:hypothetical protein